MGEHYEGHLDIVITVNPEPDTAADELNTLGKHAYQAYCAATGGVSAVTGAPLPQWEEQAADIRSAWIMAGIAVVQLVTGT